MDHSINQQHQQTEKQLTLTASKVDPMAIKLEIKRAQYHTLRGDLIFGNAGRRVDVGGAALAIDVE